MTHWRTAWAVGAAMLIGLALVAAGAPVRAQGKFPDVDRNHWAFRAVEGLAEAGLVLGYPDGKFLGNRTLTRYEMATLVKRVLDNLNARIARMPQVPRTDTGPAAGAAGVTKEQIAQVQKLIEEYKVELAVIGTDLAAAKTAIQALQSDVQGLKDVVAGQRAELDTLNQARTRVRIDGYIQGRLTNRATTQPDLAPENVAPDTTRGYTGNNSTFHVRRARVNIRGDVSDRSAYRIQLDARTAPTAESDEITVKEAYVVLKGFPLKLPAPAQGRRPFLTMDLWVGQQVTPFGHYLVFSSGDRLSPERYIAFSDTGSGLFPNQDYDKGVSLRGLIAGRYRYDIGFFNGNGAASNDLGRRKDFIGRIGIPLAENWDLGISGYDGELYNTGTPVPVTPAAGSNPNVGGTPTGQAVPRTRPRKRSLLGIDTQYYFRGGLFPHGGALKLEYVRGKGGLAGHRGAGAAVPTVLQAYVDAATVEGYYGELSYNLNSRLTLATAYEYFNRNADPADSGPLSVLGGRRVSKSDFAEERFHFGGIYFLDPNTRLRLWYESPLDYPNPPGGSEAIGRTGVYTAEVQVKF